MSGHPAFTSLEGFSFLFLMPLLLAWATFEAVTGGTEDLIKWMRAKWRNRKR